MKNSETLTRLKQLRANVMFHGSKYIESGPGEQHISDAIMLLTELLESNNGRENNAKH